MAAPLKYDWEKVFDEYIRSSVTLKELAKRHGIKYGYLTRKSSREKWCLKRDEYQKNAREAVAAELAKQVEQKNDALGAITVKDAEAQVKRSMQTGDRLYVLFQAAVTAMQQGDLRTMRQAIDAWVALDTHMRKVHRIDDNADKPIVNIAVLSALPDRADPAVEVSL